MFLLDGTFEMGRRQEFFKPIWYLVCNYSAIHSKQGCHCERAFFASEAVSQSMVFPVQHEIASGKKRPRNDSLNSYSRFLSSYLTLFKIVSPSPGLAAIASG
jgi:hypothetical protein